MALFKIDVEKQMGGEYWTNRYFVDAADFAAAAMMSDEIVTAERAFHGTSVTFTKSRTSDITPGTDVYSTIILNLPGLQGDDGTFLPLFNVLRADLSVGIGRPSRKYYRGVLRETHIIQDGVDASIRTTASGALNSLLTQITLVDVDSQPITLVTVSPFVGMRQLRRGSKRRAAPII